MTNCPAHPKTMRREGQSQCRITDSDEGETVVLSICASEVACSCSSDTFSGGVESLFSMSELGSYTEYCIRGSSLIIFGGTIILAMLCSLETAVTENCLPKAKGL